jgi:hypothetical protein
MQRRSALAFATSLIFLGACAPMPKNENAIAADIRAATPSALGAIRELTVKGYGVEKLICQFRPNEADVRQFFSKAVVISQRTRHDRYDIYPCWAHGELHANERWTWKLNAGGSAELTSALGDVILLADPAQSSDQP